MRKLESVIIILVMSFMLLGCTTQDNDGKIASIVSNNNLNHLTSENEDYIFFTDSFYVSKIAKEDNTVESIYREENFSEQIIEMECFSDKVYLLTSSSRLIAMATDGTEVAETTYPAGLNPMPTFYTYDNGLYIIANDTRNVWKVNTEELTLEEADKKIVNQYVAADGTIFINKTENDLGKVYVVSDGEEKLFSAENESVILNRMNFTDSYVFYYAFDMEGVEDLSDLESFFLYRVDLNGENKKLIKEVKLTDGAANIKYDNEYIYISVKEEECLKIHKETLKETNIKNMVNRFSPIYEVSNERLFAFTETNFLDTSNGELIELR